jgi:hypothetical protein
MVHAKHHTEARYDGLAIETDLANASQNMIALTWLGQRNARSSYYSRH